jgi:competence protein ComEC
MEKIHILLVRIGGMVMRALLLLLTLLFPFSITTAAESNITGNVKNIDLNLKEHEMAITFIGAVNGGAALIQGSNGENVLAYSGGNLTELEEWLSLYKIKDIKKLIISKEDSLSSNLDQLIEKYQVNEVIAPAKFTLWLNRHLSIDNQLVLTSWNEGSKMEILPEMMAEVQYSGTEQNEGLDFTLHFLKYRLLLMNSFSERAEQKLLTKNLGEINIFKVPNSAKDDTLSEKLIEHVNPEVSILFSGHASQNGEELVDDLYRAWSEVYFSKPDRTITIKFTQASYEVFTIPPEMDK